MSKISNRIRYGKIKTFLLWLVIMKRLAPSFPEWAVAKGDNLVKDVNRTLIEGGTVRWNMKQEKLPIFDHIEMSGFKSSHIISYKVEKDGSLEVFKHCAYPSLRMRPNVTSGSFSHNYDNVVAKVNVAGEVLAEKSENIDIKGKLIFCNSTNKGYRVIRTFYPCVYTPGLIEKIEVHNDGDKREVITLELPEYSVVADRAHCEKSLYVSEVGLADETGKFLSGLEVNCERAVEAGQSASYYVIYYSKILGTDNMVDAQLELKKRDDFIHDMFNLIRIETPEPIFDYGFSHMVLRGSESIFDTKAGLMHSPGGGVYYGAIWTNDQVEYSTPFFAYSGYATGIKQALNVMRLFASEIDCRILPIKKKKPIPCSIACEGDAVWDLPGDRGDCQMYGYGAARFALTCGKRELATELYAYVKYCIDFTISRRNSKGVITSDKDELEGRFLAGKANLFTNCLAYDLMLSGAMLARDLGYDKEAGEYSIFAEQLKNSLLEYFSFNVEGYDTFRYYKSNRKLRSWICMPMCVGINERSEDTINALYGEKLYNKGNMKTGSHRKTCWDRSLLFALKGTFMAGYTDKGYEILKQYTKERLLGNHSPYAIEAFPEGNRRHLAAESILYARIFTEGILGYRPEGLNSFSITPNIPKEWEFFNVKNFYTLGNAFDICISEGKLTITDVYGALIKECNIVNGMKVVVRITEGE
ncbi:MAG: hypothetical protein EOM87_05585 [Clostridia bacterium]|nr:hypothetical protein [Clostridia bacterium]